MTLAVVTARRMLAQPIERSGDLRSVHVGPHMYEACYACASVEFLNYHPSY